MDKKLFNLLALSILVVIPIASVSAYEFNELVCSGTMVNISDGDTINVACNGETLKVRIAEIDTPETEKSNKPCYEQPFGDKAKQFEAEGTGGKIPYRALTISGGGAYGARQ